MKKIIYIITILLLSIITLDAHALRTSRFEPTFEADTAITDNQLALYFGWDGEEAKKTTFKIEFDTTMIELKDVVSLDDFKATYKEESKDGSKRVYSFTFESENLHKDMLFGAMVFTTTKKFNVGDASEIKVYEIYAYGEEGSKFRNEGYYINFKRQSMVEMLAIRTDNEKKEQINRKINYVVPFVIVALVLAFLIAMAFVLVPSVRQEDRKAIINSQLDPKNYPIPGVGPFPKIKKKEKHIVIEPETKTIQPLAEFVSKSDDTNNELKNKALEVDKELFKTNPTRGGEEGLININPMAFDKEQEDVLDDGSDDDMDTL